MSVPTRVLYLDHTAKLGGAEITLVRILKPIDRTKVTPLALLAEDGPLVGLLENAGVPVRVLPLAEHVREVRKDSLGTKALLNPGQLLQMMSYARKVARFARRNHIDIIHTNSLKAHIYGVIAGKMARIPVVWHIRDFIDTSYLPLPAVNCVRWMARKLPSHLVAVSASTLAQLNLVGTEHAEVLYDGLTDEELAQFSPPEGISSTDSSTRSADPVTRIGMIGRIGSWKGQHVFLDAASKIIAEGYKAQFVIIGSPLFGEDDYLCDLHKQVERLGIADHVEFTGFVQNIPSALKQLDIVVHASTSGEPFGMVIVEGMAAGKPVIASRGGGVPEIIVDEECGLLYPMGDAQALAEKIQYLLDAPEAARSIGMAASHHVRKNFTANRAARQLEEVYAGMLRK